MSYRSALFTSAQYSTSRGERDPEYRVLRNERMNKNVLEAQYAVRGAIPLRAEELRDHLEEHGDKAGLPFDKVVNCNIGNPQQLDQKPLTFLRQVSRSCPLRSRVSSSRNGLISRQSRAVGTESSPHVGGLASPHRARCSSSTKA